MKFIKAISIFLCAIMMMLPLSFTVSANELPMPRAETDIFYTPAMNAGITWSGYDADKVHDLSCSRNDLTGNDVNIYFYGTGVGLSDNFYTDETRLGVVTVKEDDFGPNTNETLYKRTGIFSEVDGVYRIRTWYTPSNVLTTGIESNYTLELYILVDIETKPSDTGTAVPKEFLAYRFGTDN